MMLRDDSTARSACKALGEAKNRVQSGYSSRVGDADGMRLGYIDTAEELETILGNEFARPWVSDLLHTPRHWYILGATPAIEPMEARPANLAVSRAYQVLTEHFDRLITEFADLTTWLERPGPILILDANVLMHCVPLDTIDWKHILGVASEVVPRLVVPLAVVDELDRKKFEGGEKPRKRAAAAIHLLHDLIATSGVDEAAHVKAAGNSRVTLEIPRDDIGRIRMQATDDELIAFAAFLRRAGGGLDVRLVTRDLGAQLRARRENLSIVWLPDECLKDTPEQAETP